MRNINLTFHYFYIGLFLLFYILFHPIASIAQLTTLYKNTPIDVEKVSIKSYDNITLTGYIFIPSQQVNLPAIIIHHGFGNGSKDNFYLSVDEYYYGLESMPLAEELARAGFISFVYDQRGTGESGGMFNIESRIKDIAYVLEYIKKVPYVNPNKIGILGHSLGAYISSVAAAVYKDFKATALWATPSSFEYVLDELLDNNDNSMSILNISYDSLYNTSAYILRNFPETIPLNSSNLLYLPNTFLNNTLTSVLEIINFQSTILLSTNNIGFIPDVGLGLSKEEGAYIVMGKMRTTAYDLLKTVEVCETINPEAYVDKIRPPVLFVHGTNDDVVPLGCSELLYSHAQEPKEIKIIENTDHNFRSPEDKRGEAIGYTVDWFTRNLK